MKKGKYLYLTLYQFLLLAYFILTTLFYFMSLREGNEGVTINLFGGGDDGFFYWEQAKNVASGNEWVRTSTYPLIIGSLLKITGLESVYIIRIFNYLGFIALVVFSMRLIKVQYVNKINTYTPKGIDRAKINLIIFFFVYLSLHMNVSLSIYRDIWIYLFYVICVYISCLLMYYNKGNWLYRAILLLSIWILAGLRDYAAFSFILSLIIFWLYNKVKTFNNSRKIVLLGIVIIIIYYTLFIDVTVPVVNRSLRDILNYRTSSLDEFSGGSQMWIDLAQPNFVFFLINYAHSYLGNLIGPLPWHISGGTTLLVFVFEAIPIAIILVFIYINKKHMTEIQKYILLHAGVWNGLIAFSNDNIGTASRLRPISWILILIVFTVINETSKKGKEKRKDFKA